MNDVLRDRRFGSSKYITKWAHKKLYKKMMSRIHLIYIGKDYMPCQLYTKTVFDKKN